MAFSVFINEFKVFRKTKTTQQSFWSSYPGNNNNGYQNGSVTDDRLLRNVRDGGMSEMAVCQRLRCVRDGGMSETAVCQRRWYVRDGGMSETAVCQRPRHVSGGP